MNYSQLMQIVRRSLDTKSLDQNEYKAILHALETNTLFKKMVQAFPPRGFEKIWRKARDQDFLYRHRLLRIDDVHDPIFSQGRIATREWLAHLPEVFAGPVLEKDYQHYSDVLLDYVEKQDNSDCDLKENLKNYIIFIFQEYRNGSTGAMTLFQIIDWIEKEIVLNDKKNKRALLIGAIFEASNAYKNSYKKYYQGLNYSCMPGLDERILDVMTSVRFSLEPQPQQSEGVPEDRYLELGLHPFLKKGDYGTEPSCLLYALYLEACGGYTIKEKTLYGLSCLTPLTSEYKLQKDCYVSSKAESIKKRFDDYMAYSAQSRFQKNASGQIIKQKGIPLLNPKYLLEKELIPYMEWVSDNTFVLVPDSCLEKILQEEFNDQYEQCHNYRADSLEELSVYYQVLDNRLKQVASERLVETRESVDLIKDSVPDDAQIVRKMSELVGFDEEYIKILCALSRSDIDSETCLQGLHAIRESDGFLFGLKPFESHRDTLSLIRADLEEIEKALSEESRSQSILRDALYPWALSKISTMTCASAEFTLSDSQMLYILPHIHNSELLKGFAFRAAEQGYFLTLEYLLKKCPFLKDIIDLERDGHSLLQKACRKGSVQIVELLLSYRVNVERDMSSIPQNSYRLPTETALMLASTKGFEQIVKLLIQSKCDVNATNAGKKTALIMASDHGHFNIVKLLVENGAIVDMKDYEGVTAFMKACARGHVDIIYFLYAKGANPHVSDIANNNTIMIAAFCNQIESLKFLISLKVDVNQRDHEGQTALIDAASQGLDTIVEILIESGACVHAADIAGDTALKKAYKDHAKKEHLWIARRLILANADPNQLLSQNKPIFIQACSIGDIKTAELLILKGCDVDGIDSCGRNALMLASFKGQVEIVDLLLSLIDHGAEELNTRCHKGNTALMYACLSTHPSSYAIVQKLLNKGANMNIENHEGKTPFSTTRELAMYQKASFIEEKSLLYAQAILFDKTDHPLPAVTNRALAPKRRFDFSRSKWRPFFAKTDC